MDGRNPETVTFGEFQFVPGDGLWRDGQPIPLPPRALAVLTALLATPGTVVPKQTLTDAAWPGTFVTESSLLEAIKLLRDTLGDDRKHPVYIQTVHRRGYRFIACIAPVAPVASAYARERSGELRRDLAVAAVGREGGPVELPFFSGPEWRPIVVASVSYVVATICVAIVFAVFGQSRVDRVVVRTAAPRFAISHNGGLVYVTAPGRAPQGLSAWEPVPSPDDSQLLATAGDAVSPSWTPGGLEIAFAVSKAGPFTLAGPWQQFPTSWSRDGTQLAFTDYQPLTGADIWVLDLRTRTRRVVARSLFDDTWARFSPDGRWIAYMSNESGRWEVYLRSASGGGARVRVSSGGGAWPSWSNDGATVYFSAGGNTMASAIHTTPALVAAAPTIIEHGSARPHGRADLRIVLDWFSELAAQVRPS